MVEADLDEMRKDLVESMKIPFPLERSKIMNPCACRPHLIRPRSSLPRRLSLPLAPNLSPPLPSSLLLPGPPSSLQCSPRPPKWFDLPPTYILRGCLTWLCALGSNSQQVFVRLYVINGLKLQAKDSGNTSDPFCVVSLGDMEIDDKKNRIMETVNPYFGRCFELQVFHRRPTLSQSLYC